MPVLKAGIDAGGTLIKIAYEEDGRLHFKKYPVKELDLAMSWLKIAAPQAVIAITGGKAETIQKKFFNTADISPEFDSVCQGARQFIKNEGIEIAPKFMVVNIGTGTSWHVVEGDNNRRILGSGLGGGTLMGLGELLAGQADFYELVKLAEDGDKGTADLLVKNIYETEEPPIDGNLTAANFAKGNTLKPSSADKMASLSNLIAETIALLTLQSSTLHNVKDIVYIGTSLAGNSPLKSCLERYTAMMGLKPVFLSEGEFSGAYGAMMSL